MNKVLMVVAVLAGAGIGLGVSSHEAPAGGSSPVVVSALVVEAGWRRN